jgi:hypothetical protein
MKNYPTPWTVKRGMACQTIVDAQGDPVARIVVPPFFGTSFDQQTKAATLMAIAPELLKHLSILVDLVRRSDFEIAMADEGPITTDSEWQDALEDAQLLLAILAKNGIVAGDII